ncbi:MAG: ribose-phosphate diphosphokinase, partial [Gaiellaceae bacterium]
FAEHYRRSGLEGAQLVSVSPDLGRVKLARRLATMLGSDFAVVTKTRPAHDVAEAAEVIGDVRGRVALLGDDMIVTGGTLIAAARALTAAGVTEVRAFATHALFARDALERLAATEIAEVAVTDTVSLPTEELPQTLTVLSVAGLLAQTIENVFADRSVSSLFAGLNELF